MTLCRPHPAASPGTTFGSISQTLMFVSASVDYEWVLLKLDNAAITNRPHSPQAQPIDENPHPADRFGSQNRKNRSLT